VILLDENIPESQRLLLLNWRIRARQIGQDFSTKGVLDEQIVPLLHHESRTTFFTRDRGFYDRRLCHARYCLVVLDVGRHDAAVFVRRFLRDGRFKTWAKRSGVVGRVSSAGISLWRLHGREEAFLPWEE